METMLIIEQELRTKPELIGILQDAEIRRRAHGNAKAQAADGFLHELLNRDRDGMKVYCFFEGLKERHGWNQMECPKRFLFAVLRKIMQEVESNA